LPVSTQGKQAVLCANTPAHHRAPQVESSGTSLTQDVVQRLGNFVLRDGSKVDRLELNSAGNKITRLRPFTTDRQLQQKNATTTPSGANSHRKNICGATNSGIRTRNARLAALPLSDVPGQAAVGRILHVVPPADIAEHHHHGALEAQNEVVHVLQPVAVAVVAVVGWRIPQQDDFLSKASVLLLLNLIGL
jgi:hypothetical protein